MFQVLEGWFTVKAIISCRDLNVFINIYDLFTNAYEELKRNRVQLLNETEAANIQIPLWIKNSTFNRGPHFAISLSQKIARQYID